MVNSSTVVHGISFGMIISGVMLALTGGSTLAADVLMLSGLTTDVSWSMYWSYAANWRKF